MKKEKGTSGTKEHQKTHAILGLALILGVGRERLTRALSDNGMPTNEKLTVAQAFAALSAKFQKQDAINRQREAEAETAEIALAEKKGELVPKKSQRVFQSDLNVEMRKTISSRAQWKSKELLLALAKIKSSEA